MTFILIFIMLGVFVYYFVRFIYKMDVSVTQTVLASTTFPEINLGSNNFFISMAYRVNDQLQNHADLEQNWLKTKVYLVEISNSESTEDDAVTTTTRTTLDLVNCKETTLESGATYSGT